MRQAKLLEEVGGYEWQVVVGQVEDLSVVIDGAGYRRQRSVDALYGLKKIFKSKMRKILLSSTKIVFHNPVFSIHLSLLTVVFDVKLSIFDCL